MKLVFIVADAMFDSALPLIKRLKDSLDLICILEFSSKDNIIGVDYNKIRKTGLHHSSDFLIPPKFNDYLPLDNTYLIRYHSPRQIIGYLRFMSTERQFIDRQRADYVFYFNEPLQAITMGFNYKGAWGMGIHDPFFHSSQEHKLICQFFRKILFRNCDYFLFSKTDLNNFINSYRLNRSNVHVLSLGPYEHLREGVITNLNKIPERSLELLFFGKIRGYKGLRYLLEALKQMIQNGYDDIRLTIAGKGQIENDIIDLEDSKHLRIFNRYIPDSELATLISECDVVVCPYTDATQSGVIMSAYAFCKPVIATNVGGLAEMVENNRHGLIVPPRDSKILCALLSILVNNREPLTEWSKNIKQDYYKGEKGWDVITEKFVDIIRLRKICRIKQ